MCWSVVQTTLICAEGWNEAPNVGWSEKAVEGEGMDASVITMNALYVQDEGRYFKSLARMNGAKQVRLQVGYNDPWS